ncbi:hypothetical protein [Actinomadura sp. HBU206391]|uniref:hypothetical protein n=1 Tax=Actinomadura sp. HBU206391 TaxID=2731692 RepID=UPI0016502E01|nr:hypothetical protein [Actinomadura sp. HBU206391]MBC6463744.1 hypothetical protein [Actinomadura sp. HBU206391]
MNMNTTYMMNPVEDAARSLKRAGLWDPALDIAGADSTSLRAEILTDGFWWRLERSDEAEAAVAALLEEDSVLGGFYDAQLAYTRVLFRVGPRADDGERTRAGFSAAADDERLAHWATFWLGVVAEHGDHAPEQAVEHYTQALDGALEDGDLMLESYATRHLGGQALENGDMSGLDLLRRSYHLRAALGARPHTAAAAATLADSLPPGSEAEQLKRTAARTARELRLTWLAEAL